MNTNVLRAAFTVLGLASSAAAQQSTLTATITEDLNVVAQGTCSFCFGWSFWPVGPLPAGGVTLSASALFDSSAQMDAAELTGLATGVTGFRWTASGHSSGSFEGAYASAYGAIELQLALPVPGSVLVVVEGSGSTSGGSPFGSPQTFTAVDIDGTR